MLTKKEIRELIKKKKAIKLDIGCGEWKQKDFIGIDNRDIKGVDIVHDFESYPYPLPKECAGVIMARGVVEHNVGQFE